MFNSAASIYPWIQDNSKSQRKGALWGTLIMIAIIVSCYIAESLGKEGGWVVLGWVIAIGAAWILIERRFR